MKSAETIRLQLCHCNFAVRTKIDIGDSCGVQYRRFKNYINLFHDDFSFDFVCIRPKNSRVSASEEAQPSGPAPKAALRFELLRIARSSHRHGPDQAASERWCSVRQGGKASATNRSALLHGRRREKGTRATKINFSWLRRALVGFYVSRSALCGCNGAAWQQAVNSGIQLYVECVISPGLAA